MTAMQPTRELQPGDLVASKYRVEQRLGEGAMGTVWAVVNLLTERRFALKLVTPASSDDPEFRSRLLREARAAGRIAHRNVVEVYDVGETEAGAPFLVMQLLSGETLEQRLAREALLSRDEALHIALEIARALVAAHTAGIVHRDLKPANVFLHRDEEGQISVKVVDFGVSKLLNTADATGSVTGLAIGSPAYMSPEQARGERALDHRTDIWALGVLLFEMTTGSRPFGGTSQFDTVAEILKGHIPTLSERLAVVDPGLEQLVAACLQRERDSRPSTAREVQEHIRALLALPRPQTPSYAGIELRPQPVPMGKAVSTVAPSTLSLARTRLAQHPLSERWPLLLVAVTLIAMLGTGAVLGVRAFTRAPAASATPVPAAPPPQPREPAITAAIPSKAPPASASTPAPVAAPRRVVRVRPKPKVEPRRQAPSGPVFPPDPD